MKTANSITVCDVKDLQKETGDGLMACQKILLKKRAATQKEYANDALFDVINKWNGGLPQEAFMELIEVVIYLVNK